MFLFLKSNSLFFFIITIALFSCLVPIKTKETENKSPRIAILSSPVLDNDTMANQNYKKSRIDANYVHWLEASGAEVVVIHPWWNEKQIFDLLTQKVNGILIQGELLPIDQNSDYFKTVEKILEIIISIANESGFKVPLLAIGHGMHLIHTIIAKENILQEHTIQDVAKPLIFDSDLIKKSKMFSNLKDYDFENLMNKPVTAHFSKFGIGLEKFESNYLLRKFFRVTSLVKDDNGNTFVASSEAYNLPIYGLQFHPEKISYDRIITHNIPQSHEAIRVSRIIGNWFVNEARTGNHNVIESVEELNKYNYINVYINFPNYEKGTGYFYYYENENISEKFI